MLRSWRAARGLSQLDLALRSGLSARHVSFIETGRTQPSRQALLAIGEALEMPLRERNRLLEAGGYARLYRQTALDAEEMQHGQGLLRFVLERHEPYSAVAVDRYWNVILMRHRAVMLGLLGGFVLCAAFRPALRAPAIFLGTVSLASLVSLAWSIGDYNQALSAVVFADTIAVVCFLIAAALHVVARRRS